MIPSIARNTVGGLLACILIGRYGPTRLLIIVPSLSSGLSFSLLLLFWRGNTPVWQALFSFATGITYSAIFVALAAGVGDTDMPIAVSGLYLSGSAGRVAGLSAASAVFQSGFEVELASCSRQNRRTNWTRGVSREKRLEKA
ncbi:hypothetical protein EDB80DRAFT_680869 [Ilyonectria destructans]|nr:hypothetical protein EDB80DRAFT_680869 [Ilyonectria destructans]